MLSKFLSRSLKSLNVGHILDAVKSALGVPGESLSLRIEIQLRADGSVEAYQVVANDSEILDVADSRGNS